MRYKMEKKYQLSLEEYRALVNKYQAMFNDSVPALVEVDWDFDRQIGTIINCINTKTSFVHGESIQGCCED